MDAASSPVGVSGALAAPAPVWTAPASTPVAANVELPTPYPRAAQRVTAVLLLFALSLIGWRAWAASRWSARPTALTAASVAFRLDLNRADLAELMQLPGVGESLARRIDAYRHESGGFRAVEDLRHVSGIGPATLERLRPFVYAERVGSAEEGEETPPAPARLMQKPAVDKRAGGKKEEALTEKIDLNRATAEELQRLPSVGPALSARIITAREKQPFRKVDDLRRVSGIGAKTLEKLRPHVVVGGEAKQAARED